MDPKYGEQIERRREKVFTTEDGWIDREPPSGIPSLPAARTVDGWTALWVIAALAFAVALVALLYFTSNARAQQPVPYRPGQQCPSGTRASGGYCVQLESERCHPIILPKPPGQQCPSGYSQSGNYCREINPRCGR